MIIKEDIGGILKPKSIEEIYRMMDKMNPYELFLIGARKGNINAMEFAIKKGVNPATDNSLALHIAAQEGNLRTVNYLLNFNDVDPSNKGEQYTLWAACEKGNNNIVKRLLEDPRVNPAKDHNSALMVAAEEGHLDIVKTLLKDPRVTVDDMIIKRIETKLKRVMGSDKQKPYVQILGLLYDNINESYSKILKPKSKEEIDEITAKQQFAIAILDGDINIIKFILNNTNIDPSENDNVYFSLALSRRQKDNNKTAKLLFNDPRVRSKLTKSQIDKYERKINARVKESLII